MQKQILNANPDSDLKVYAVWFNMYPGDDQSRWPRRIFSDPRVVEYWDQDKTIGRWYGKNVTRGGDGHIEWDAYFLYGSDAVWGEQPEPLLSWGRTIVGTREQLRSAITPLLRDGRGLD